MSTLSQFFGSGGQKIGAIFDAPAGSKFSDALSLAKGGFVLQSAYPKLFSAVGNGQRFINGQLWTGKFSGADQGFNFTAIATDGAGTWLAAELNVGLFRSTDNGKTWNFVTNVDWVRSTTAPYYFTTCTVISITYSQGQWALYGNFSYNANKTAATGQVSYSTDGGASFMSAALPSGAAAYYANFSSAAVTAPNALLTITQVDAYIWRSTDNGRTWAKCYTSTNGTPQIQRIFIDATGVLMAILYNGTSYFILRSTDSGVTWSSIGSPITTPGMLIGNGLGRWLAIPILFSSTAVLGVSTDGGVSWSTLSPNGGPASSVNLRNGAWDSSGALIMIGGDSTHSVMYSSTDGGVTFSAVSVPFTVQINSIATDNAGMWVAVGNAGQMAQSSMAYSGYSSAIDIALPAIPSNNPLFEKYIQVS